MPESAGTRPVFLGRPLRRSPVSLAIRAIAVLATALPLVVPAVAQPPAATVTALSTDTLRLASGGPYFPYVDETLPDGGLFTHIVRRVFKAAGQEAVILTEPWARGRQLAKQGRIDGTFPYSHSVERENIFYFSRPVLKKKDYLFVRSGRPLIFSRPSDLAHRSLCRPRGLDLPESYQALVGLGVLVVYTPASPLACFDMLVLRRVDAVAITRLAAVATLAPLGAHRLEEVDRLKRPFVHNALHLIVGRSHPRAKEILASFEKGLRRLGGRTGIRTLARRYMAAPSMARILKDWPGNLIVP